MVNERKIMTIDVPASPARRDYTEDPVYQAQAKANAEPLGNIEDPMHLFARWLADARQAEPNDANAMSLATVDEQGRPDVRIVLLKDANENGFGFYSNEGSAKGQQLAANAQAALAFHWKSLRRQVRIRGAVARISGEQADAYFASRARGARIGAWASAQSRTLASRAQLEGGLKDAEARFAGQDVPRPPHWGGWRVIPSAIEFWRDRPFRLHDRLLFTRQSDSEWIKSRLYP